MSVRVRAYVRVGRREWKRARGKELKSKRKRGRDSVRLGGRGVGKKKGEDGKGKKREGRNRKG